MPLEFWRPYRNLIQLAQREDVGRVSPERASFIAATRRSVDLLLSPLQEPDRNNVYGTMFPVPVEGLFFHHIDPSELQVAAQDRSMDIFIGRESTRKVIYSWILDTRHRWEQPHMVIDVTVRDTSQTVSNTVYIIEKDAIRVWERQHRNKPEALPQGKNTHTEFISSILTYAQKHPAEELADTPHDRPLLAHLGGKFT